MAVLGVAVLVHLLVEPAYYQRMLVARLERRLHRRVTVTSADVTLWPGLGLRLRNVAISKKPPEPDHPVLSMEALRINVRLLPLLARRIVVQRIVIERPVMAVARDEDGTLRLADLLGEPERQESGVEEHRLSPPVESLLVATTEISHGEVRLFDQATTPGAVTIRLSDLSLEVEQLASGSRPQFKLDAKIGTPGAGGSVALAGRIGPLRWSWPAPNLSVDGEVSTFALDVQPFLPYLPAQWRRAIRRGLLTSELSVRGRLDGNVTAQGKLRLEQVELRSRSSRLAGAIEGEFAAAGRRGVAGGVASHLRIDATEADYRQGSVFHKEPGTKLVIEGDVLGERGSVRVRRVAGALGAIPFAGAGKIGRPDRAGRALLVLRFDPTVIDLATLPGYVAATSPLALRGRADVRGVEIRRRPEKRREWQVRTDVRLSDVHAVIPLEGGRAHTLDDLAARVELDVHGHAHEMPPVQARASVSVEHAEFLGSAYRLAGAMRGHIEAAARRGVVEGKADLRLAPATFTEGTFVVDGATTLRGAFRAGRGHVRSHVRIDATDADSRHGNVVHKEPGIPLVVEGDVLGGRRGIHVRHAVGELGGVTFLGSAQIGRSSRPGRAAPFSLYLGPARIDLTRLPRFLAATAPFALRGWLDMTRLRVRRLPEEAREWQVTADAQLASVRATIPLEDGRAHTVDELSAEVHLARELLTAGPGRVVLNRVPLDFRAEAGEFPAMFDGSPDRPRTALRFEARGTMVDVDRLLKPARRIPAPGRGTSATAGPAAPAGVRPLLRRFTVVRGEIQAKEAIYRGQRLTNPRTLLAYDDPVLRLDETRFQAFGGRWDVDVTVTLDSGPLFGLVLKARDVRLEDMITSLSPSGNPPTIYGRLDGEGEFHGRGRMRAALERTLGGSGHVTIRRGRMPTFNMLEAVIHAFVGVFSHVLPVRRDVSFSAPNTFERLDQSFRVADARVYTHDLSLVTDDYQLTGQGSFGFDTTLDYDTNVALTGQGTQRLLVACSLPIPRNLPVNLPPIPVRVTGRFAQPTILPDVSAVPAATVHALLGRAGAAVGKTVGGTVKEGGRVIGEALGRILGREPEQPPAGGEPRGSGMPEGEGREEDRPAPERPSP